jgi:hypothetical protein
MPSISLHFPDLLKCIYRCLPADVCSGTLIDGTVFDSSYDRGEPTAFAPNQVIKVRAKHYESGRWSF